MDEAFIEHPEDNVDGYQRQQDQNGLGGERIHERGGRPLEAGIDAGGKANAAFGILDGIGGLT